MTNDELLSYTNTWFNCWASWMALYLSSHDAGETAESEFFLEQVQNAEWIMEELTYV